MSSEQQQQTRTYEDACLVWEDSRVEVFFISPNFQSFISSSHHPALPPVLLDFEDNGPDDVPIIQEEVPCP
jgi:hypothetical protein